jgi:hypothetical protein
VSALELLGWWCFKSSCSCGRRLLNPYKSQYVQFRCSAWVVPCATCFLPWSGLAPSRCVLFCAACSALCARFFRLTPLPCAPEPRAQSCSGLQLQNAQRAAAHHATEIRDVPLCPLLDGPFDSRWVPPVGGAPSRRTSTSTRRCVRHQRCNDWVAKPSA